MTSLRDERPVIQNEDPIRLHQRRYTLRNQKCQRARVDLLQRFSKRRIRCQIQRRHRIIEDQDPGLSHEGSGDRKTLFLSAGQIGTTLRNGEVQPAFLLTHKFLCLCDPECFPDLLVCCIPFSELQVFPDRSLKQDGVLRYNTDLLPKHRDRTILRVLSVYKDFAARDIIETGDQLDER